MKAIISHLVFIMLATIATAQTVNHDFDAALAEKFGADQYGMKNYVLVILKTGSRNSEDNVEREKLFAGHFENINRMTEAGKLILAGPISENANAYRGIFVLNVATFDEANEWLEQDPTIKEKLLEAELYNWYGSAALSEYIKTHEKIVKFRF